MPRNEESKRPVKMIRSGSVKLAIWENTTEKGTRYNVSAQRLSPSTAMTAVTGRPRRASTRATSPTWRSRFSGLTPGSTSSRRKATSNVAEPRYRPSARGWPAFSHRQELIDERAQLRLPKRRNKVTACAEEMIAWPVC